MPNTILIVDDEPNLRKTLTRILQKAKFQVRSASNGKKALKMLEFEDINLAFIDLMMPGMDGIELITEIKKLNPDLPVLILTGNATLDTAIEAVRQGARDYLLKPADPELIIARIQEVLDEQAQPKKQRKIISQIQSLSAELHAMTHDGSSINPSILYSLPPTNPDRFLTKGLFQLDLHARHLTMSNNYISLSPSNFDYLVTLTKSSPDTVSYEKLVKESQGYELTRHEAKEMSRWRIHELRKAIENDPKNPKFIITVRGSGYRLLTE